MVPFDRQEPFIGRSDELQKVTSSLFSTNCHALVAIEGLGGIGKSRLALEVAYEARQAYTDLSVFWLQCSDYPSFEQGCRKLIEHLAVPGATDLSKDPKSLMKGHLEERNLTRWLLILDNADNEDLWSAKAAADKADALINFIPRVQHGSVLITTRNHRVAVDIALKNIVKLAALPPTDSQTLLRTLLQTDVVLKNTVVISQLLDYLTHLPLAIVQAAAFMNQNNIDSVEAYVQIWRSNDEKEIIEVLSEDFTDNTRYRAAQNPVAKTWLISFKDITAQYPLAVKILSYMACVNPKDMLKSCLPPLACLQSEQHKAFGALQNYAFIKAQRRETNDGVYDMHRLVHLATRNYFRSHGGLLNPLREVAKHLSAQIPRSGVDLSIYWQKYLPHAEAVVSAEEIAHEQDRFELQRRLGTAHNESGAFSKALVLRTELVECFTQTPNINPLRTIRALSDLSQTLCQLGWMSEALSAATRAYSLSEEELGTEDPARLLAMETLADVYGALGRYEDCRTMSLDCVQTAKKCVFRDTDLKQRATIAALGLLSGSYGGLQRHNDQEKVLLEALDLAKRLRDRDNATHRHLAKDLAMVYCRLGRAQDAERLLLPMKDLLETRLGRLHNSTLVLVSRLADCYQFQGVYPTAEAQYRDLMARYTEAGRHDDTQVLSDRNNLAHVLVQQGKYVEAKSMLFENIGMTTQVSGKDSILALQNLQGLAWCYRDMGKEELALRMLAGCVTRSASTLGADNPVTLKRKRTLKAWQEAKKRPTPQCGKGFVPESR